MTRSRQHITYLGLNNRESFSSRVTQPDVVNIQERGVSTFITSVAKFTAGAWPPLARLTAYYPRLRQLRISVQDGVVGNTQASYEVARRFDQLAGERPAHQHGPLPWVVVPCRELFSLTLHSPEQHDLLLSHLAPVNGLFLSMAVPCAAQLRVLDISKLCFPLLDTLLQLELPNLVLLQ